MNPSSRRSPRTALMRAVRVESHPERRRWSAARVCWCTDLMGTEEAPRSCRPRATPSCRRGRSCSRVDTASRGEVGAGRRRVPTFGTSLPRSEPSRRLREARWQRSVWQRTTPIWVDSHELLGHLPPLLPRWQSRRRSCKIHSDCRIFHSDSSFSMRIRLTLAHRMPSMSVEESIPSLDGGSTLCPATDMRD